MTIMSPARRWGSSALALGVSLVAGCPAPRTVGEGGDADLGEQEPRACATALPAAPPALENPGPVAVPTSRLALRAEVSFDRIAREVERQVPTSLASAAKKPIGAPGRVTYQVTRGRPEVGLSGTDLDIRFVANASVEVCKPLGPLCPVYGSCSPSLNVRTKIPLAIGEDYALGKSSVGLDVARPCAIVGLDVTDKMMQAAEGASRDAKKKVDESIPPIRPLAARAWADAQKPLPLPQGGCVTLRPERLSSTRPRAESGALVLSFAVMGQVSLHETCPAEAAARPTPLPPLERADGSDETSVLFAVATVSWGDVEKALASALVDAGGPSAPSALSIRGVGVRGHRADSGAVVALRLTLEGEACGDLWVLARPVVEGEAIVLRDVRAFETGTLSEGLLAEVRDRLARVEIGAPSALTRARAALDALPAEIVAEDPIRAAGKVERVEHALHEVLVGAGGLGIVGRARAVLRLEAR